MAKTICTAISPQANATLTALRDGAGLTTREICELALADLSEVDPAEARRRYNALKQARGNRSAPARLKKSTRAVEPKSVSPHLGGDDAENPFAE